MTKALVSVIIVNWNGMIWLPACLSSLREQIYKNIEIIIVDNNSTDGSVDWIKKFYPKTKVTKNSQNHGFASANNIGYKQANGEYLLFLNNDTRVTCNFLTELVGVVNSAPLIAGAQSKILLMDHTDTHDSIGAFLTPTGFLFHYGFGMKDEVKYNKLINLFTAKGACMLFKKSVLDQVAIAGKIFDDDYFAYFEETDLCHRIWLAGYRIVYAFQSVIFHKMGATSISMENSIIQYHSFKNRIRSYLKNLSFGYLIRIMYVHIMLCEILAVFSLLRGNFTMFIAIQKAIGWNIMKLPETWNLRSYIQSKIRKLPDRVILKELIYRPKLSYFFGMATSHI